MACKLKEIHFFQLRGCPLFAIDHLRVLSCTSVSKESNCGTFVLKMTLICLKMNLHMARRLFQNYVLAVDCHTCSLVT